MIKKNDREFYRARRLALTEQEQTLHACSAVSSLQNSAQWSAWQHIAAYWPNDGELQLLHLLIAEAHSNKTYYLPCLSKDQLIFKAYAADTLLSYNRFGIPEPLHPTIFPITELDCVLVPMVSLTALGQRLGRGGGFFDKTFNKNTRKKKTPWLIGAAHECQRADNLQSDVWDISLDSILTEAGYIDVNSR